jgi:hypothetical protein
MVHDFYWGGPEGIAMPSLVRRPDGAVASAEIHLPQIEEFFNEDRKDCTTNSYIHDTVAEIGRNLQVVEYGGNTFEVTRIKRNPSDDYMLHASTYSSAISTNPGNAYELALASRAFPGKNIAYCASFGNGGTGPLHHNDRRYVASTGRFTVENDEGKVVPITSIVNMYGALQSVGINPWVVGSDSAGGNVTTALGVAMPEDAMTHGFFSARPNLVNLSMKQIVDGMLRKEGKNGEENKQISPDVFKLTDKKVTEAKEILADTIRARTKHDLQVHGVGLTSKIGALVTSMNALRRGPEKGGSGPLLADTNALLQRQPYAKLTYLFGERDPLYLSPDTAKHAIYAFLGQLTFGKEPVTAIVHPGTHAINTYFPEMYISAKKAAYSL